MHPSSCKPAPLTPGPLEALSVPTSSSTRFRRPRRVMYPASQSRRAPLKEAPDPAHRWLLLLSALVFLQIYTEDAHTCTELQSPCSEQTTCGPQEDGWSLSEACGGTGEESWRYQTLDPQHQTECVVA